MDAVTDDTTGLGATIEGVRKRRVETLYLGTDKATTVGAGCGQLPNGFLSRLAAFLLLLTEKTPIDGEAGQLLTLLADIRDPVLGQNVAILVSNCPGIGPPTTRCSHKAVVYGEV